VKVTALRNPCEQIKPPTRAAQAGPQPRRGRAPGPQGQDQGIVLRGGLVRPGDAIRRPRTSIPSRLGSPTLKTARSWCAATGFARRPATGPGQAFLLARPEAAPHHPVRGWPPAEDSRSSWSVPVPY